MSWAGWNAGFTSSETAAVLLFMAIVILFLHNFGLYRFEIIAAWPRKTGSMCALIIAAFFILIVLAFALKISEDYSRVWVFSSFSAALVLVVLGRGLAKYLLVELAPGLLRKRVAVFGATAQARRFLTRMSREEMRWHEVVGIFDNDPSAIGATAFGYPICGDLQALERMVRKGEVASIVVALPWDAEEKIGEVVRNLRALPITVYLADDLIGYSFPNARRSLLAGVALTEIEALPLATWNGIVKMAIDLVLGALLLAVLSPLMLLVAAVIKLESPGPAIFRQKRCGYNNGVFVIHKFRTMHCAESSAEGGEQARPNDSRVTRVGRFLRRTSLDELPQLFDVLLGTMSLVGPRPHAIEHHDIYADLIPDYAARHKVKPGITGWAQIKGWRGQTTNLEEMQARIEHDIYYIQNWTPWFDFKILVVTALRGWIHSKAF